MMFEAWVYSCSYCSKSQPLMNLLQLHLSAHEMTAHNVTGTEISAGKQQIHTFNWARLQTQVSAQRSCPEQGPQAAQQPGQPRAGIRSHRKSEEPLHPAPTTGSLPVNKPAQNLLSMHCAAIWIQAEIFPTVQMFNSYWPLSSSASCQDV